MMKRLLILVGLALTLTACEWTGNYEDAYFVKSGDRYQVEMKGRRRLMAHDPISGLRGRTYEETLIMDLPRIEGEIAGSEIPVPPDKLKYKGRVVITKAKMKLDLYYDNPGESVSRPLPWNGEYTLVPRETP